MAYTEQDLAELQAARKSGLLTVRHADGRQVTFQSAKEMRKLEDEMRAEIDAAAGKRRRRTFRVFQSGRGI